MVEVGTAIAERNLRDETDLVGYRLLESICLKASIVSKHVIFHIEQGSTYEFHGLEARVE